MDLVINTYRPIEKAIDDLFDHVGLPKLGGMSSLKGWTSISTYQRCNQEWFRMYGSGEKIETSSLALELGIGIHLWSACYYMKMINDQYPLDVDELPDLLIARHVNPDNVFEIKRVVDNYRTWYKDDYLIPLAVEQWASDKELGATCRYDLVAQVTQVNDKVPTGIYIVEHKSRSVFFSNDIHNWRNDGEILGQQMMWKSSGMEEKFGPLAGTIINIIGKQKKGPKCHRTLVTYDSRTVDDHRRSLKVWLGKIDESIKSNTFERSRQACKDRQYGICSFYDDCAGDNL